MLGSTEQKQVISALQEQPDKLVLSNLADKSYPYRKTVMQKMMHKGEWLYQIEQFTDKQAFHENVSPSELVEAVLERFPDCYRQLNVFGNNIQWDFKVTKKGTFLCQSHKVKESGTLLLRSRTGQESNITVSSDAQVMSPVFSHNRKKNYILQEGIIVPPLVDLGIFTKEGTVVRTMYDKYKQINRFLELVRDVVKNRPKKEVHIIDFGCGKSYLTFILYYYLVEVQGYQVHMTGLDLKEDVIRRCNETAKKYHYDNLHFELGDINGYQTEEPVDMVVTLHACDTATDYALYNAVSWNADIILSVPCCQHEVNAQIASEQLSLLTRYGIVKERMSALMTDAIRANVLEYCGYSTQLLEFIDIAHSPKNILIRAVKNHSASQEKKERARAEVERLCSEFHIEQTLEQLIFKEAYKK